MLAVIVSIPSFSNQPLPSTSSVVVVKKSPTHPSIVVVCQKHLDLGVILFFVVALTSSVLICCRHADVTRRAPAYPRHYPEDVAGPAGELPVLRQGAAATEHFQR